MNKKYLFISIALFAIMLFGFWLIMVLSFSRARWPKYTTKEVRKVLASNQDEIIEVAYQFQNSVPNDKKISIYYGMDNMIVDPNEIVLSIWESDSVIFHLSTQDKNIIQTGFSLDKSDTTISNVGLDIYKINAVVQAMKTNNICQLENGNPIKLEYGFKKGGSDCTLLIFKNAITQSDITKYPTARKYNNHILIE